MTRRKPKLVTLEVEDIADDTSIVEDVPDVPVVKQRAMPVVKKRVVVINNDVLLPRSASRYVPQMR